MEMVCKTAEEFEEFKRKENVKGSGRHNFCTFYIASGTCKFNTLCTRRHIGYEDTKVILIPNLFQYPGLGEGPIDASDLLKKYDEFYEDIMKEMNVIGTVKLFKCCINRSPNIKGNVYVEFATNEEVAKALKVLNGHKFRDKNLEVILTPINNWIHSLCGTFGSGTCKRNNCHFLHIIRNPRNEYFVRNREVFDTLNFRIRTAVRQNSEIPKSGSFYESTEILKVEPVLVKSNEVMQLLGIVGTGERVHYINRYLHTLLLQKEDTEAELKLNKEVNIDKTELSRAKSNISGKQDNTVNKKSSRSRSPHDKSSRSLDLLDFNLF